eukprot:1788566-Rhodomonas_salina.1
MGLAYIGLTGVGREFVCAGPLFGRGLYLKTGRVSFMQVGSALCLLAGGGSALANREQLLAGRIKEATCSLSPMNPQKGKSSAGKQEERREEEEEEG